MAFDIICPSCHRLFSTNKEQKEVITETLVQREGREEDKRLLVGNCRGGTVMGTSIVGPSIHPQSAEDLIVYKLHLKCKHCGHEWTRTRQTRRYLVLEH